MEYFKNSETIYFSKLKENAVVPNKLKENAGYDIFACFEEDYILLMPLVTKLISTGIAWACSDEFYMQIQERSSTGKIGMKYSGGVIDSGYRGEIKIAICNCSSSALFITNLTDEQMAEKYKPQLIEIIHKTNSEPIFYSTNKAIAQGIIHKVEDMEVKELPYDELKNISSARQNKGFGSTNK